MNDTPTPTVFIVILNWNGVEDTLECLASIRNLNYPSCHTVVIDNGSTDGSPARLKAARPDIALIELPTNLGYTGGSNTGIQYALARGADFIWLLNSDTIVSPDSLSVLVTTACSDDAIALISPMIYDFVDTNRIQFWGIHADMVRQTFYLAPEPGTVMPGTSAIPLLLWGTALLVRSAAIRLIGQLDDRYFAYHEDLDYSLRAIRAGLRTVVEPQAVIYHKGTSASRIESPFKGYLFSRNLLLLWSTHLHGFPRYTYPFRYMARAIRQAVDLRESGHDAASDACLNGAWSALRGRYGPPGDHVLTMPAALRRVILGSPSFWIWLLTGRFGDIMRSAARRLARRT